MVHSGTVLDRFRERIVMDHRVLTVPPVSGTGKGTKQELTLTKDGTTITDSNMVFAERWKTVPIHDEVMEGHIRGWRETWGCQTSELNFLDPSRSGPVQPLSLNGE
jgi:hypothetical protein